jgi:hypothetical protein
MSATSLQAGDRVRAKCSTLTIRPGMVGTVLVVVEPTKTLCLVRFDALSAAELAPVDCLERVEP